MKRFALRPRKFDRFCFSDSKYVCHFYKTNEGFGNRKLLYLYYWIYKLEKEFLFFSEKRLESAQMILAKRPVC